MKTGRNEWTLEDQLALVGRSGRIAQRRAERKHRRLANRAERLAVRSTRAHELRFRGTVR